MIDPVQDRRAPISPQLALRVAVIGVVAFALFGIVFFRLWYLQVLSGDQYLKQAQTNRVRLQRIQAPRGQIVDRNGDPLVKNRQATVIKVDPEQLPQSERTAASVWGQQAGRRAMRPKGHQGKPIPTPPIPPELRTRFRRLAAVVRVSPKTVQERVIRGLSQVPYSPVTIRTDVPNALRNFIAERADEFPGIKVERTYLRLYPHHNLAAQIIGTVGEINPDQLKLKRYRGVTQGTVIGQSGLERAYDRFLRGADGAQRFFVNAQGQRKGSAADVQPIAGHDVKLSLDLGLQKSGQDALLRAGGGKPGAFVALNPNDGEVYAVGSYPSFDPSILSRPISQAKYDQLFNDPVSAPGFNRAIAGAYPTGSTFKPITALAGLASGVITSGTVVNDSGCLAIGTAGQKFCNAGSFANGSVDLRNALKVSSDVYFYTVGRDANAVPGQVVQRWARRLGLGHRTGIDLADESPGLVPDRNWRAQIGNVEKRCRHDKHIALSATGATAAAAGCGISDMRPWTVGDNVNLAVGQGDLQATPLQMAVAYSAIANGGKVVRPHLGTKVEDDQGRPLQGIDPGTAKHVSIDPNARQVILDGLHAAASESGGTSAQVWSGWDQAKFPVYGKTGTAQRGFGRPDQSWYVAYVPAGPKSIVVAVTIEGGGFGAEAAAPATRQIISRWLVGKPGKFVAGHSKTR